MLKRSALATCGLVACSVSLALLAIPYPAVAQSAQELRAEIEALRKENATLRQRNRLSQENAALHKRLAQRPAPAPVTEPSPREAHAADLPVKAPPPAPVVAGPSWAGFYIGAGVSRERRKTTQGDVLVTSVPVPLAPLSPTLTRDLTLDQFASAGHVLGGFLWQYNRIIVGLEGDYYFGGRTSKDPRYLVPENCTAGVISVGNFGCGSGAAFGSFQTRGHVRGIAGWEAVGRVHGEVFGAVKPVATMVEVSRLIDPDHLIEIEVDAFSPAR